ncbi:MAG: AraC family transcriptional regulator [Tannerella sp.]|jgi:AraC-like DNA-binding protein|nr:AraC family transcriptional regulator [Tannerella sp.]
MLKEYTLSDRLFLPAKHIAYYACTLDAMRAIKIAEPHRQTFYSMVWFVQGKGFKVIDFNEHRIRSGRIFLVNPDQINNCTYPDGCKGYVLMFAKSLASQLCIEFSKPYIDIEKGKISLLQLVFENLIKDCQLDEEGSLNKIMASIQYFYSLIAKRIHSEVYSSDDTNHTFRQFKELILTNELKIQPMDQYADTLNVSMMSLNAMCHDFTGVSAKQLLLDLKITEAKRLLLYSGLNINEISFQLGFEDASYFARIFKKKARLSPSRFLKKYRK